MTPNHPYGPGVIVLSLLLAGCTGSTDTGDTGSPPPDLCAPSAAPSVLLGAGVGGAFAEYADDASVGLTVAPQGGFGVVVLGQTAGLLAGDGRLAQVLLETVIDGAVSGSFLLADAPFYCNSNGSGGFLSGVVVGFSSTTYATNDSLLSLNGAPVTLHVAVTDSLGGYAEIYKPVTIVVGNE